MIKKKKRIIVETLEELAKDQNEDVRILVAMNINAPLFERLLPGTVIFRMNC